MSCPDPFQNHSKPFKTVFILQLLAVVQDTGAIITYDRQQLDWCLGEISLDHLMLAFAIKRESIRLGVDYCKVVADAPLLGSLKQVLFDIAGHTFYPLYLGGLWMIMDDYQGFCFCMFLQLFTEFIFQYFELF